MRGCSLVMRRPGVQIPEAALSRYPLHCNRLRGSNTSVKVSYSPVSAPQMPRKCPGREASSADLCVECVGPPELRPPRPRWDPHPPPARHRQGPKLDRSTPRSATSSSPPRFQRASTSGRTQTPSAGSTPKRPTTPTRPSDGSMARLNQWSSVAGAAGSRLPDAQSVGIKPGTPATDHPGLPRRSPGSSTSPRVNEDVRQGLTRS
jgi:hypothetical protein